MAVSQGIHYTTPMPRPQFSLKTMFIAMALAATGPAVLRPFWPAITQAVFGPPTAMTVEEWLRAHYPR